MLDKPHTSESFPNLASHSAEVAVAPPARVADLLGTDLAAGLPAEEAERRLTFYGINDFGSVNTLSWLRTLTHQFVSTVVLLLVVAVAISFALGEYVQAAAIGVAILINAVIGFATERQAEVSLDRLKQLAGATIRTIRSGTEVELPVRELVPGDLVLLESGIKVPADIRLIESVSFSVDESALTGESVCVFKESMPSGEADAASTQLFCGTAVVAGRGTGIVLRTGHMSALGKLGKLLRDTASGATPLEQELEYLGRQLSWLTAALAVAIGIAGICLGQNAWYMLQVAIALAVAAIPEGLQLLATLALAIGTQRMVKVGAIVRRLSAVETLGCTTIICTDKTGTLTQNQLVVTDVVLFHEHLKVSGTGYKPVGNFTRSGKEIDPSGDERLQKLLRGALLCNDASLAADQQTGDWVIHGDPTEGALLVLGAKAGYEVDRLLRESPRVFEEPFDLKRKRMTTVHAEHGKHVAYTKGSPESVLAIASSYLSNGATLPIDEASLAYFREQNAAMAARGLRVLAVAIREIGLPRKFDNIERELTFVGLVGMADRPKDGVEAAIKDAQTAGIQVVMLTGDQAATGESIARELGILRGETDDVVTGEELESASPDELRQLLKNTRVIARATPELKLSVVQALQAAGEVVAMTGDGVNDAPALKQANIGIAMGLKGSDLARDVSHLVLTDDNFRTIIRAIRQGRSIYQNIRQAVGYLLTASLAAVLAVAGAVLFNIGAHITPLQLLWLNLIMHIFPGLGMVLQPADPDVMTRPPRRANRKLTGREQAWQIMMRSLVAGVSALAASEVSHRQHQDAATTATVTLVALSLALMYQAWSWLFLAYGRLRLSRLNWQIVAAMACSYSLLFAALYIQPLRMVLGTTALSADQFQLILFLVTAIWIVSEVGSFLHRCVNTGLQKPTR
jgi:Ca2+-transporting ATPase